MPLATSQAPLPRVLPAALVAFALAIVGAASVSMAKSMGYDESMHAELPAARMLVAGQLGEWKTAGDVFQACQQYPFVYPLVLCIVQAFTGVSELAARMSGRVCWGIALLEIFLVAREVARGVLQQRESSLDSRAKWMPWLAMAIAALSPMALGYSGSLFLEVPFIAVAMLATWVWLRRRVVAEQQRARFELLAGTAMALAFFTKFNYGLLLIAGLGLDFLIEGVAASRQRALGAWMRSAARIAVVPVVSGLWWFVFPLPRGLETGAAHFDAFVTFLLGNQTVRTPLPVRLLDWSSGLFVSPRALIVAALAVLVALRYWRVRELRTIVILALGFGIPVAMHPYHLDRLLLPGAPYLWLLAAVGLGAVLPRSVPARLATLGLLVIACGVRADIDAARLAQWAYPQDDPALVAYQREIMAEKISLWPSGRVPTAGLERAESEALLDAIAKEVGSELRIGWFAPIEKLPPGALQVGLLARGGPKERLLLDPVPSMFFGVARIDPQFNEEQLKQVTQPFDVILSTDPLGALGGGWGFIADYRSRLKTLGYAEREFARVTHQLPMGKTQEVRWLALRRIP